eukprot:3140178-Amphidinium_carterae.1
MRVFRGLCEEDGNLQGHTAIFAGEAFLVPRDGTLALSRPLTAPTTLYVRVAIQAKRLHN